MRREYSERINPGKSLLGQFPENVETTTKELAGEGKRKSSTSRQVRNLGFTKIIIFEVTFALCTLFLNIPEMKGIDCKITSSMLYEETHIRFKTITCSTLRRGI
jgi:hypothetical protein